MFIRTLSAPLATFAAAVLVISLFFVSIPANAHAFLVTPSVVVSSDASSPAFALVPAGSTDVTANVLKMRSSLDSVSLRILSLKLTSGSSVDVSKVSVYANGAKVGEGVFAGATSTAVVNLSTPVTLQNGVDTVITVKADLTPIGNAQAISQSGHLVQIDYASAYGVGVLTKSGANFSGTTSTAGFRVMKSVPTVSLQPLPAQTVQDGRLMRFAISADAHGPVGISQLAFSINQMPLNSLSSASLYEFTDSGYSMPTNTAQGLLGSFVVYGSGGINRIAVNGVEIPAGQTRYFELRASVYASVLSVTTTLMGDNGYMGVSQYNPAIWGAAMAWSPNSTTTASIFDLDWFDAFAVPGLPAGGLVFTRSGVTAPAPTCSLSAVTVGTLGKKTLSWTTTNANDLSIESDSTIYGSVTPVSAGSMTIYVSESEYVTGTVTGPGGTAYCSIFVSGPKLNTKGIIP